MPSRLFLRLAAVAGALALGPAPALAARRVRPLFEPTDLELERPGVVEADLQTGFVQGRGPARLVIPDFELDLGLTREIELDLDGAYAIEGPSGGPFAFDHAAPDSLWLALKAGLVSLDGPVRGISVGVQAGPKLPVASGSHGLGAEALVLVGVHRGDLHLVFNLGGLVDPVPGPGEAHPRGLEAGVDLALDLDDHDHWKLTGELGAVRFLSDDPHQLTGTAGAAWSPNPDLEISLVALCGLLAGGDRWGVLLGVSPKFALWR